MAYGKRLLWETLKTETAAAINDGGSGDYIAIGSTAGNQALLHPIRLIKIDNTTDVLLTFSFDGINDQFVMPASSSLILDVSTNKVQDGSFFVGKGEVLYATGLPTSGSVYFSAAYAKGD